MRCSELRRPPAVTELVVVRRRATRVSTMNITTADLMSHAKDCVARKPDMTGRELQAELEVYLPSGDTLDARFYSFTRLATSRAGYRGYQQSD